MSRHHDRNRWDDRDRYQPRSRHHRSGSGSGWWWLIGALIVLGAYQGVQAGGGPSKDHVPSHRSTVCTQYFKGGC